MRKVNIYTYSTAKSPKSARTQCEAVAYVLESPERPDMAVARMKLIRGMSANQSEIYVLERALTRINTLCEVHVYTESG